ncbi:MAG: ATP-binding protein [Clostridiales bacterium]|jgi:predicted AAA+ superfamily ATPase|nr:ATP-binding protein [Clostridiales bacterium]
MDNIIERKAYTENIKGFVDKDVIKVITGIRRCGKSEILKLLKKEVLKITDNEHIVFINFEDIEFDNIKTYKDLYGFVLDKIKDDKKYYLFFDEIQSIEAWERAINSLRLKNTDIYITGSNSKLLSGELATLIGGRYVQFEIRPLSFDEFLQFRKKNDFAPVYSGVDLSAEKTIKSVKQNETVFNGGKNSDFASSAMDKYYFNDYFLLGGFPLISTQDFSIEQAVQLIKDIHSSIVLKDVVSRNKIKNVPLLEKIVAYFYDNIGNLTSLRGIADYLSGGDKKKATVNLETLSTYVSYLETAYVIKKVPRYDIKGKRLFETNDKYYLADHSLAYVIKDINKVNKGGILENIVYNELVARGYTVYVGKLDNKEVDFVAEKNGEKIYLQVCLEFTTKDTYAREFNPLKEIKDNYPKYVVLLDNFAGTNDEGVIGISLKDFLLKKEY